MRTVQRFLILAALVAATGTLSACSLDRLTGTKPKPACMTRSYTDTIYVTYDSLPDTLTIRLGGCKS